MACTCNVPQWIYIGDELNDDGDELNDDGDELGGRALHGARYLEVTS